MARKERQEGEAADATRHAPRARMRERFGAGDHRGARELAWRIANDPDAPEADREEARRLLDRTEVDRRAWAIGALALAIAAAVTILFLL